MLRKTVGSSLGLFEALGAMDTMRWLERVSYYTWRICNYLGSDQEPQPAPALAESHRCWTSECVTRSGGGLPPRPPLCISRDQVDESVERLDRVLADLAKEL